MMDRSFCEIAKYSLELWLSSLIQLDSLICNKSFASQIHSVPWQYSARNRPKQMEYISDFWEELITKHDEIVEVTLESQNSSEDIPLLSLCHIHAHLVELTARGDSLTNKLRLSVMELLRSVSFFIELYYPTNMIASIMFYLTGH